MFATNYGLKIVQKIADAVSANLPGVHVTEWEGHFVVNVEQTGLDAITVTDDEWLGRVARESGVFLEPINSVLIGVYPI